MRSRRNRKRRLRKLAGIVAVGIISLLGVFAFRQARIAQHNTITAHFLVAGAAGESGQPDMAAYWYWRAYSDAGTDDPRKLSARDLIASWTSQLFFWRLPMTVMTPLDTYGICLMKRGDCVRLWSRRSGLDCVRYDDSGRALTGDVGYQNLVRAEYVIRF